MSRDEQTYDPRFLAGVTYFNECEFFEAHDEWEEYWADYHSGPSRAFLQGLIQVAVALFHFGNGNARGAIRMYHSSKKYLADYAEEHMGVDLGRLIREFDVCFSELLESSDPYPAVEIDPDLIPEIHFVDPSDH